MECGGPASECPDAACRTYFRSGEMKHWAAVRTHVDAIRVPKHVYWRVDSNVASPEAMVTMLCRKDSGAEMPESSRSVVGTGR